MGKYVFGDTKPSHQFIEKPLIPGHSYTLCSRNRVNRSGEPYGIGKIVYQSSKRRWVVLCYDKECDNYFQSKR